MNVSFNEIENIVKTIPIGYYIGRNIDLTLSETSESSYYVPMEDRIAISYPMLNNVLSKLDESYDPEVSVRNLIYHETSHALLTPKNMEMTDVYNIFEDERIETLLANFYKKTNFKEFVKQVNNYKDEKPSSADEAFYHLVRFRKGDTDLLIEVANIIKDFKDLNNSSPYTCDYRRRIDDLYYEVCRRFISSAVNDEKQSDDTEQMHDCETDKRTEANCQVQQNESHTEQELNVTIEQTHKELELAFTTDEAKELLQKAIDNNIDNEMLQQTQAILSRVSKTNHKNGSAINAYSGVFDPRSVGRQDYKYFVHQNRTGHVKAYSKIHLTLFVDCSGSFCESEDKVNKLMYALRKFEQTNPDFTFDLVTMSVGERLMDRDNRVLKCRGGNVLDNEIFNIYKDMQKPMTSNYNIVLFDGDAFSDIWSKNKRDYYKNFGAFNNSNCVIISDEDNECHIKRYCKNAKTVITKNYVEELQMHVMNALQILTR